MNMTKAPRISPKHVPTGPAEGRNVVPGITKAPHPTAHPKESAQTCNGERYLSEPVLFAFSIQSPL